MTIIITTKEKNVSADKTYDVECRTSGSKPAAVITWWKGNKQLKKMAKNVCSSVKRTQQWTFILFDLFALLLSFFYSFVVVYISIILPFQFSEPDNQSLSVLTITIKKEDDGKFIACRAENQHIFNSMIEDKYKLNVMCKYSGLFYSRGYSFLEEGADIGGIMVLTVAVTMYHFWAYSTWQVSDISFM